MIYDIFENRCQADPVFDVDYGELVRGPKGDPGNPGAPGSPGAAGVSPSVSVTEITGGHRVTITDATGTRSFDVPNGADGEPGEPGSPGAAGVSPSVSVAEITGGHRVTITDAAGTRSFDVMNGEPGAPGAPGQPGQDGRTPVKGEDYFTSTEISAIESEVLASAVPRPSGAPSVGKILKVLSVNDDGTFTCEWADAPSGAVEDVQINGTSVVSDGVAIMPFADTNRVGLVRTSEWTGLYTDQSSGDIYCNLANNTQIDRRIYTLKPITVGNFDYAVKRAMCDGVGAAWTSAEQLAARQRIGLGGNLELIETITLTEETQTISRTAEPNGDAYSFIKAVVFVEYVNSTTDIDNPCLTLVSNNNSPSNWIASLTKQYVSASYKRIIYNVKIENGTVDAFASVINGAYHNPSTGIYRTGYGLGLKQADKIQALTVSSYSGNYPVGTVIKIYAVRA